jgi:hypothetical protein
VKDWQALRQRAIETAGKTKTVQKARFMRNTIAVVLMSLLLSCGAPAWSARHTADDDDAPKSAQAGEVPVNIGAGYLGQCGAGKKSRQISCLAFVAGLYEGIVSLQNNLLLQKLASAQEKQVLDEGDKRAARDTFLSLSRRYAAFCPPIGEVSYPRVQDLLLKFIRENPDYRDMSTADLFVAALARAYPCAATSGTPEMK